MSDPDIVVLRQTIHGSGGAELAAAIRERLPDRSVALARTPTEERELLETARIAVGLDIDEEQLAAAENLELFACVFAGTGHLPRDALADHGVALTNASGVHGPNIAEHVIGSMITHARQWARAHRQQERREWRSYETTEVYGSTVAVVGLGAIGSAVVDRLEPFDVNTVGVRYSPEREGRPTRCTDSTNSTTRSRTRSTWCSRVRSRRRPAGSSTPRRSGRCGPTRSL